MKYYELKRGQNFRLVGGDTLYTKIKGSMYRRAGEFRNKITGKHADKFIIPSLQTEVEAADE